MTTKDLRAFLKGLNTLRRNAGYPCLRQAPVSSNLLVMEVTADVVTAKAWYPVRDIREVEMPPVDKD